jgi:hypothetical protein
MRSCTLNLITICSTGNFQPLGSESSYLLDGSVVLSLTQFGYDTKGSPCPASYCGQLAYSLNSTLNSPDNYKHTDSAVINS